MPDTFQNNEDKKLSTPPKRSIRNIPLNKKSATESSESNTESIHLSVKEEPSDFDSVQTPSTAPITKHLVPKYKSTEYEEEDVLPAHEVSNRSYNRSASNTDISELSELVDAAPIEKGAEDAIIRIHSDDIPEVKPRVYSISSENTAPENTDTDETEEPVKAIPVTPRRRATGAKTSTDGIKVSRKSTSTIRREPAFEGSESFDELDDGNDATTTSFEPLHSRDHKGGGKKIAGLLVIGLIIALVLVQTVFARANVSITMVGEPVTLEEQTLGEKIPYQSFTKNGTKTVTTGAIATVTVSKKATGSIVIYNNYSSQPYELVKTTRFETANGSVYRLLQDVTIPGKKTVGGKDTPGSVSAKVEAEKAGSEYNAKGGLELRIPGLIKGTDKYVKIYARTSANFTGGATGSAPDTSSSDIQSVITKAKADYQAEVLNEFNSTNPGLTLIKDSIVTTSTMGPIKTSGGESSVTLNLTTKGIGLASESLRTAIGNIDPSKKSTPSLEDLSSLTYIIKETPDKNILEGVFTVAVAGTYTGKSTATVDQIKQSIAGKGLTQARNQLDLELPGSEVSISTWPFWKGSLPSNTSHITVELK